MDIDDPHSHIWHQSIYFHKCDNIRVEGQRKGPELVHIGHLRRGNSGGFNQFVVQILHKSSDLHQILSSAFSVRSVGREQVS